MKDLNRGTNKIRSLTEPPPQSNFDIKSSKGISKSQIMNEITVSQLKEEKIKLEKIIMQLIDDFQKRTDCSVININMTKLDYAIVRLKIDIQI